MSGSLTIPVGFRFYQPDPNITAWRREDKRLRQKGVSKKYRTAKPERDDNYPTKISLAVDLLKNFKVQFDCIKIRATIADAFYGSKEFVDGAVSATGQNQVLSQIKKTQLINVNGKFIQVHKFFSNYHGKSQYSFKVFSILIS